MGKPDLRQSCYFWRWTPSLTHVYFRTGSSERSSSLVLDRDHGRSDVSSASRAFELLRYRSIFLVLAAHLDLEPVIRQRPLQCLSPHPKARASIHRAPRLRSGSPASPSDGSGFTTALASARKSALEPWASHSLDSSPSELNRMGRFAGTMRPF